MIKPTIRFYRSKRILLSDIDFFAGSHRYVVVSHFTLLDNIKQLELGQVDILYVGVDHLDGWRTNLNEKQCHIIFIGEGWSEDEIVRGNKCIRDSTILHKPMSDVVEPSARLGNDWSESLENWWKQASDEQKKLAYAASIASGTWKAERIRELEQILVSIPL